MNNQEKLADRGPPWERDNVRHPFVTEAVKSLANMLFSRIASARYSFGTRLPAEREIADEFGISRTIVRKALKMLEAFDVIARQHGRGSFVIYKAGRPAESGRAERAGKTEAGHDDWGDIAEITSPLELSVVRTIVEPEIVRLATINMSARDIANLREIVNRLSSITTNAADFAYWDEQFHLALAQGTHNLLLIAVYRLINNVRRHSHWIATKEKTLSPNRIREYQKLHQSICSALEARDIESAMEFIKLLMVESQRDLTLDT